MTNKITIRNIFISLWIILIPFQDSGLQSLGIGFLGKSPSFIPLIAIIFLDILKNVNDSFSGGKAIRFKKIWLYVLVYMASISLLYLIISYISLGDIVIYKRNLIFKSINLFILTVLFIYPIFFIKYHEIAIKKELFICFIVTILGVFLCDYMQSDFFQNNQIFHSVPYEYSNQRPRGFSLESSWLAIMIISLGFLLLHYLERKMSKFLILITMLVMLIFSISKGAILSLAIVTFVILNLKLKLNFLMRIFVLFITLVMVIGIGSEMVSLITVDITRFTSSVSRITLIVTSFLILLHNPLGVGFTGALPAIHDYLPKGISLVNSLTNFDLNFFEVKGYIDAVTDTQISTKTLLTDYAIYFGIPFIISFFVFNYKLLSRLRKRQILYLYAGVFFLFITLCTYSDGIGMYNISLLYGIAFDRAYRK